MEQLELDLKVNRSVQLRSERECILFDALMLIANKTILWEKDEKAKTNLLRKINYIAENAINAVCEE